MKELSLIKNIVKQVGDEKFDAILCCGRGGLVPAAYIAHALDIKIVHHMAFARGAKDAGMRNQEAKFLIVDDISDSGETLKHMLDRMGPKHKTAVLFQRHSTSFKCDFVGEHINHDAYIYFSWDNEVWKEIPDFPNYEVSSKSFVRRKGGNVLKPHINKRGYMRVSINADVGDKHQNVFVHRLVLQAFVPNPLNKEEVNHKDGNPFNNELSNLEWATRQENAEHAKVTGLYKKRFENVVLDEMERLRSEGMSYREIGLLYGVNTPQNTRRFIEEHKKKETGNE